MGRHGQKDDMKNVQLLIVVQMVPQPSNRNLICMGFMPPDNDTTEVQWTGVQMCNSCKKGLC